MAKMTNWEKYGFDNTKPPKKNSLQDKVHKAVVKYGESKKKKSSDSPYSYDGKTSGFKKGGVVGAVGKSIARKARSKALDREFRKYDSDADYGEESRRR